MIARKFFGTHAVKHGVSYLSMAGSSERSRIHDVRLTARHKHRLLCDVGRVYRVLAALLAVTALAAVFIGSAYSPLTWFGGLQRTSLVRDGGLFDAALMAVPGREGGGSGIGAPRSPMRQLRRLQIGGTLYVNMDSDTDKRQALEVEVAKSKVISQSLLGLQRVPGVVGRRVDLHEMLRAGKIAPSTYNVIVQQDRPVGGEYMTVGGLGCLLSHVEAWRRVAASGGWMIVLEDDVLLEPDFDEEVEAALAELPADAGMLYFGNVVGDAISSALSNFSDRLWAMSGEHWGTYAYALSADAARVLLDHVFPADVQVDSMIIRIAAAQKLRVFMMRHRVVRVENGFNRASSVQRYAVAPVIIPRIFHFIWLGGKALPDKLRDNVRRWHDMHPNWRVRLWTEDDIGPMYNARRFSQARTLAQQSDILRYEIVQANGGIYVDLDFEPLRNIEPLLHGLKAFVAYESDKWVCNGIFGAVPGHPLLDRLVRELDDNFDKFINGTVNQQTGPHYMTATVKAMGLSSEDGFQAFAPHIFFPYLWGQRDPGPPYNPLSFAVHDFEKAERLPPHVRGSTGGSGGSGARVAAANGAVAGSHANAHGGSHGGQHGSSHAGSHAKRAS